MIHCPEKRICFRRSRSLPIAAPLLSFFALHGIWCAGEDLNLHVLADTSPSSWPVCQFQHPRLKAVIRRSYFVIRKDIL